MSTPTHLKLSEIFTSLQGEGPSTGSPSVFLRLALCNLRCRWCDTPYTWDFNRVSRAAAISEVEISDVARRIGQSTVERLVVTGGEPLLQQSALRLLLSLLQPTQLIELETNGTILPHPALLERVDHWNVSPKLAGSGETLEARWKPDVLHCLRDTGRAWLKLVVDGDADLAEADYLLASLAWPSERIVLMPQAATREQLRRKGEAVASAALARGYRYSSRLHIELWDGERGR